MQEIWQLLLGTAHAQKTTQFTLVVVHSIKQSVFVANIASK